MTQQNIQPNLFQLANDTIQISYSTSSINGQPLFSYQDENGNQQFSGDDIRRQDSELGALVTVSIARTVDTGYTSLTLLIPNFKGVGDASQSFETLAVVTKHLFGVLPRSGQQSLYSVYTLSGSAQLVSF